ncbi:MAG TPA: IS1380 family transposase [Candidatus Limnocylindrales bacterium]|nr:IS1380 family transposase [Candidatus Limnocylindrales bacterium]
MKPDAADNSVPREISALLSNERLILRETQRAVTPLGGVAVFVAFLHKVGFVEKLRQHMPIHWKSSNYIDPNATFTAFLMAVLAGAKRFAHANWLRNDRALHALLGLSRFPTDDTIRNLFRRFGMGDVHRLFDPLAEWQMERLPTRHEGYSLDLDSTVLQRYGRQQGSLKGHNPRKHGRPSHHPLLAVLAEAHFLLHGWLRSGNCGAARGVVEFLQEALALWGQRQKIRLVRADSGFFEDKLLSFLEQRSLSYIVVARLTKWTKREAQRVQVWQALDENYSVGEFRVQLLGWERERRFVVVRELVREGRNRVGRKLLDVPGYTFRLFVTSRSDAPEEIWRDYNRRADMENRIAELKHDLGADGFCLQEFFATEAAFQAVLLLFNLLAEFQRAAGLPVYRQPATLRTQVFTCGAILGRAGRRLVLHLSQSWGRLKTRNPLLDKILSWEIPTSPKLGSATVT